MSGRSSHRKRSGTQPLLVVQTTISFRNSLRLGPAALRVLAQKWTATYSVGAHVSERASVLLNPASTNFEKAHGRTFRDVRSKLIRNSVRVPNRPQITPVLADASRSDRK